jgi:hypothetical protein
MGCLLQDAPLDCGAPKDLLAAVLKVPRTQVWDVDPITLDAAATKRFWEAKIDAYQQWVVSVHPTGAMLAFDRPQKMQRGVLLWHHFDWVLDNLMVGHSREQLCVTRQQRVKFAEENVSAEQVLYAFQKHVFAPLGTGEPRRDAGLYGKDMQVPCSKFGQRLTAVGDMPDMLEPGGFVKVPGVSRSGAWMYSGGHGLAAHHVEDGYLHFVNVMHDLQFDAEGLDPLDARLLQLMHKWSIKQWLFVDTAFTPAGALRLQQQLLVQGMGLPACDWPKHLCMRTCLLSPEYCTRSLPQGCRLLLQRPGQCILGNSSHSVIGLTLCSAAWNVALGDSLLHYHACQCIESLSTAPQDPFAGSEARGHTVRFGCAPLVLRAHYHQAYESSPPMRAAAAALARLAYVNETAGGAGEMRLADDAGVAGMTFSAGAAMAGGLRTCSCMSCGYPLVFSAFVVSGTGESIDKQALLCGRCVRVLGMIQRPECEARCLLLLSPRECWLHADMPIP